MPGLNKIYLDAREMEHPEPLERSMKILRSLDENSYFHMLHRKSPLPLIDFAQTHHFQVFTKEDAQKQWHVLICKSQTINLSALADV